MGVIALHTAYVIGWPVDATTPRLLCGVALAAYAAYAINAAQFLANSDARASSTRRRARNRARRGGRASARARPAGVSAGIAPERSATAAGARRRPAASPADSPAASPSSVSGASARCSAASPASSGCTARCRMRLSRRRVADLCAPPAVRRRRHDLRRAAVRDGDPRRARPRRPRRRQRRARSLRRAAARAAPRDPDAVPRRLAPVRGHQARPRPRGAAAARDAARPGARAALLGERHRDDVHRRRGRLPRRDGPGAAGGRRPAAAARPSLLVVGALADAVEGSSRGRSTR